MQVTCAGHVPRTRAQVTCSGHVLLSEGAVQVTCAGHVPRTRAQVTCSGHVLLSEGAVQVTCAGHVRRTRAQVTCSAHVLLSEGAVQLLCERGEASGSAAGGTTAAVPILAAVGQLQLEVVASRLQTEYGVEVSFEPLPFKQAPVT